MTQVVDVFLYNEDADSVTGEYRYLVDGNDKLLRSYILDRFEWPYPNLRYPLVFQKGAIVRLNPDNEAWDEESSLSNMVQPVVKEGVIWEDFGAFRRENWRYRAKEPNTVLALLGTDPPSRPGFRPQIEGWASGLPLKHGNRQGPSHLDNGPVDAPHASQPDQSSDTSACAKSGSQPRILEQGLTNNRATGHRVGSVFEPGDRSGFIIALQQTQPSADDPFVHIWEAFRKASSKVTRRDDDQGTSTNSPTPPSAEIDSPQLCQSDERQSRSFHFTTNQKAGSHVICSMRDTFSDIDHDMMDHIKESLARLIEPLRMWPGVVDLKVELGRFCFLNVKRSHIQKPGDNNEDKHYELERIRQELKKRHIADDKLYFTQILTTSGTDANFIGRLRDSNGQQMWKRPGDGRSSVYQFTCRSKTLQGEDFNFVVEIDAVKFTSKVRPFSPDNNWFAVHCTKRIWDFRLVLSVSKDLSKTCGHFAEDLLRSLRVRQVWV
jgi:hypothetical protein